MWARLPDDQLLDLRFCDLGLSVEKFPELKRRVRRVRDELQAKGMAFDPHFWVSDEWFTPDGVPGVAIPFYLAHPRLKKLERKMMLEVEGGSEDWCMRILRHEVGHAIDNAYRLHRRRKWRTHFGRFTDPYPDYYQPKPYSRSYVLHLDMWYAQAHPSEDFAETFAVWLTPGSRWKSRYKTWPAMRKLEYVDELMHEIAGKKPLVHNTRTIDPTGRLRTTLREHYRVKRMRYGEEWPDFYDRDLRKLFSDDPRYRKSITAARFLGHARPELRRMVARWTGAYQYTIDQVLIDMIDRCRELQLRLAVSPEQARMDAALLVAVQTMNYLHEGHHRLAL